MAMSLTAYLAEWVRRPAAVSFGFFAGLLVAVVFFYEVCVYRVMCREYRINSTHTNREYFGVSAFGYSLYGFWIGGDPAENPREVVMIGYGPVKHPTVSTVTTWCHVAVIVFNACVSLAAVCWSSSHCAQD